MGANLQLLGWSLVNWQVSYGWILELHFLDRRSNDATVDLEHKDRARAKCILTRPARVSFSHFVAGSVVASVTATAMADGTTTHRFSFSDGSFAEVVAEACVFARW
jgi:hypothetical protein